ncbi:LuxR C-terminal-related transcriptional regulator [Agromyces humatus]|uniref:HTH luxR-type domain-containing protein n=1 Tax=Agromyces humatus TaxID=279573 RepID=A0ABN2KBE1_9MICO|nr:LuxR C-terminal-related transcriptional regulator [Agromyces humatus]
MSTREDTLTPRESAVLAAVERRLSNPEIAAELFISVRTVESHIASLKRKLGAESRAELMAAAGERRERAASVRLPHNAFVGRDADLAALGALLDEHPWVTVVGPGGVGKTRLALEFASIGERVPVVVELEHAEPGDVVARIARALDLEPGPGSDVASSVSLALATHPYLLVLDNVDRVGVAVGEAIARAHATTPALRVLTTSRTPIGDAGEAVFTLAPLAVGGDSDGDAPAVRMFLDRLATAGRSEAAPMRLSTSLASPAELELAAEVCARLDGLPLAIELAAAVARHLSLAELASRLERDFATLDRAVPEGRHRTLETAFEWTWDLLTDEEREVLCRLGALPRTFDVDLAAAVTHPGAEGVVLRLLDHSLIVPAGGHPRRFRLLAVTREFVRARTDPEIIHEVLRQHAEFLDESVLVFVSTARTDSSLEAMHRSETLCPEVNAALRWALAARHPAAVSLANSLSIGVEQFGSDADSIRTLAMAAHDEGFLAAASPSQLLSIGTALAFMDVALVSELAERALALAADDHDRLDAHHLAGLADAYAERHGSALEHLDEAARLAAAQHQEWDLAAVRQMRGLALRDSTVEGARSAIIEFEAAMRGYALAGDAIHVNNSRYMMAHTAAEAGIELDRAAQWAAECVDYARSIGNEHELAHAQLVQATLGADSPGELDALVGRFRRLGDLRCVTRSLVLRAERAAPLERIALLDEAFAVAVDAGDTAKQIAILTRLVETRWSQGDRLSTLVALDRLAAVGGADAAAAACPPELADAVAGVTTA